MTSISRREILQLAGTLISPTLSLEANAASINVARMQHGAFDELPIGSVRPEGWLLKQLQKQAAGVTSHLQHLYAPFTGDAWLADETDPKVSWWPWEVRGYWCDGTLRCGLLLQDEKLIEEASQLIKFTFSHPQNDGYLGPTFMRATGDANRWPHAVMFRAAMAWYDVTRETSIVEAIRRHYLGSVFDYYADRAAINIEPMLWAYQITKDRKLLELAQRSWRRSQQFMSSTQWTHCMTEQGMLESGPVQEVHGVTYAEFTKLPALLYRATGEERYLRMALSAQQKIIDHHMLVDGIPSTSETISTTTSRDAHETCNVTDYSWNWGYLMMASGQGRFGDHIERAIFNALPGSIKKDWKALQYYSSPNQFICTAHSNHVALMKGVGAPTMKEYRYMQRMSYRPSPGYSVVCCPGNLSRALPNYISRMWMLDAKDHGVAATLYGPCKVKCRVGPKQTEIEILEETDYPYADEIVLRLKNFGEINFPLHLRIPAWCPQPSVSLNNKALALPETKDGFITLRRLWRAGDTLHLKLPMTVTTTHWPEDGVAIERGPLVYAYPIAQQWTKIPDAQSSAELPAYDLNPVGDFNYALLPETETRKPKYDAGVASDDPWVNPPSSISVAARHVEGWGLSTLRLHDEDVTITPPLPDPALLVTKLNGAELEIKLVPYASTELRVAVFPRLKNEL